MSPGEIAAPNRRSVAKGAAWALPGVTILAASPSVAASPTSCLPVATSQVYQPLFSGVTTPYHGVRVSVGDLHSDAYTGTISSSSVITGVSFVELEQGELTVSGLPANNVTFSKPNPVSIFDHVVVFAEEDGAPFTITFLYEIDGQQCQFVAQGLTNESTTGCSEKLRATIQPSGDALINPRPYGLWGAIATMRLTVTAADTIEGLALADIYGPWGAIAVTPATTVSVVTQVGHRNGGSLLRVVTPGGVMPYTLQAEFVPDRQGQTCRTTLTGTTAVTMPGQWDS